MRRELQPDFNCIGAAWLTRRGTGCKEPKAAAQLFRER
jgi:hypothetical protein